MGRRWPHHAAIAATLAAAACNPFDRSQVPEVTVGKGLRPEISWTPAAVYQLQVYEGPEDRNGIGVLWTVAGAGGYENALTPPVTYGVPPAGSEYTGAPPLVAGRTYTVTVTRKDEEGGGEGFFNTRNRYVGVHTFVAEAPSSSSCLSPGRGGKRRLLGDEQTPFGALSGSRSTAQSERVGRHVGEPWRAGGRPDALIAMVIGGPARLG